MQDYKFSRPLERCVMRMTADGLDDDEIGRRLRRSSAHVQRVRHLAHVPRHPADRRDPAYGLRPIERRVMRWLDEGADHSEVAALFGRSPSSIEFVAQMAAYKLTQ
ncbi:MAG: hypothetical protein WDA60_16985 [Acidimicrobiia bacterium]|jgi:DNA-binding CsgD family transcriptional regulator